MTGSPPARGRLKHNKLTALKTMKTHNFDPGGNYTTLINNKSGGIKSKDFPFVARQYLKGPIEQVGFISNGTKAPYRLDMMGGEFCINALRAAGLWIYEKTNKSKFKIESSGTNNLIDLEIQTWSKISLPKNYEVKNLAPDLKLILLDGICHFVLKTESTKQKFYIKKLKQFKKIYAKEIKLFNAIGLIGVHQSKIMPLIEVIPTNTIIFETACGSGTLAAYIASNFSNNTWQQPSGTFFLTTHDQLSFFLNGPVRKF